MPPTPFTGNPSPATVVRTSSRLSRWASRSAAERILCHFARVGLARPFFHRAQFDGAMPARSHNSLIGTRRSFATDSIHVISEARSIIGYK